MSYDPAVPLQTDSPSIFPAQAQANFTRLKELIEADHQFNNTSAANDGYHKLVHMIPEAPAGALAGFGRFYVKSVSGQIEAFYMDDAGTEYQVTPSMPIRAACNFKGDDAVGVQTRRSEYNVKEVEKTGTGAYTIKFTRNMPDENYIVQLTGMATNRQIYGSVLYDSTYANSVKVDEVKVLFTNRDGVNQDVLMGNVTILSVS